MGKHSKPTTYKHRNNRKKIIATGAVTLGLMVSQTSAYAAVDQKPQETQTESIQRVVEKAELAPTAKSNNVVPMVTAPKDATISFERPAVATARSQAAIDAEAKVKAQEAAKVEAEKQAAIDAENAKVAAAEAAKVKATQTAQANAGGTQYAPATTATATKTSTPASTGAVTGKRAAILAAAKAQIGVAQDCTMLVTNSLKAVGINFHDWPAGYLSLGPVTTNPQPGDLIYYASGSPGGPAHVAVVSDKPGMAIHGGFNGNSTVEFSVNVGSGPVYISMG